MWGRPGDTIFALATGAGRAAIAIMRLSGPASGPTLAGLCGGLPSPRRAVLRRVCNSLGEVLDHAMVVWMPGPRTYTGEDCAELHLHAGPAVVAGVAEALTDAGARPAEPGEFTKRAFLNGKLDLLEAEAVADLAAAETAAQRRQSLRQLDGALGGLYRGWTERLRALLAHQEALIDFADEDSLSEGGANAFADLTTLKEELKQHLLDGVRAERLRSGLSFAVIGPPNAGKSSLVNALAGREAAIVAPGPGTTRDALEVRIELGGVPVTLVDTAGLRDTDDPVELEGIRRARARAEDADLVLAVFEAGGPAPSSRGLQIATKLDLCGPAPAGGIGVSVVTGEGMEQLRAHLAGEARRLTESSGPPPLTRARHRASVTAALEHLHAAERAVLPELRGEAIRLALASLGRITGEVGVEDILDTIFSRFCIGK